MNSPAFSPQLELRDERDALRKRVEDLERTLEETKTARAHWENRTHWLLYHATYRGGGDGGVFVIRFVTPLDSEDAVAQLDAAMNKIP